MGMCYVRFREEFGGLPWTRGKCISALSFQKQRASFWVFSGQRTIPTTVTVASLQPDHVLFTDSSHFYVPHYCLNGVFLYFTQSILPRVDQVWWGQIMSCLRHRRHMHGLIPWLFVSRVVCGHVCLYIYVFMCIHACAHAHNFIPTQLTRRGETCPTSDGVYQLGEENHWQCLLKDV